MIYNEKNLAGITTMKSADENDVEIEKNVVEEETDKENEYSGVVSRTCPT